jgi:Pectate lyase superfamily protein
MAMSGFHNSAFFLAQNLLGYYSPQGLDPTGNSNSDAAINTYLANALPGRVITLPPGVYATVAPIIPQSRVGLLGSLRYTQSGNDIGTDSGAVIKPVAGWTTARSNPAAIMFDGTSAAVSRAWLANIAIDGTASPAGIGGISATGSVFATGIYNMSINSVTYRGLAAYATATTPDGWLIRDVIIQSSGDVGVFGNFVDTHGENIHAQLGSSFGWLIQGSHNTWVGCRADLNSLSGFVFDAPGVTGAGFLDENTLIGCSSQRNQQHGLLVRNASATGQGNRSPVKIQGFRADGDGVNGGAGGGGFAGIALGGAVILSGDADVLVHTEDVAAGCPTFAVTTFALGTAPGKPQGLKLAGLLNAASATIINDGAPVALRLVDALGFAGGQLTGTSVLTHVT